MKPKQVVAVALSIAAIAAWIGVARSFRDRAEEFSRGSGRPRSAAIDARLDVELERLTPLHAIGPSSIRRSHRNPFRFNTGRPPVERVTARPEVQAPLEPAAPVMTLAGIAESAGADGPVRTAIVSTPNELFMVKVGDRFAMRYRVDRIGAEAVEIQDGLTGQPITIGLR
jgi:hypothetical protein